MSTLRDLAPRPQGLYASEPEPTKLSRQSKVAVACGTCRVRRTKCDGVKPECQACIARQSKCDWPASPGQQLAEEQKQRITELENDKSALYEILWYLQTTTPDCAGDLLDQLRSSPGTDVGAMVEHFAEHRRNVPNNTTSSSSDSVDLSVSHDTALTTTNTLNTTYLLQTLDARGVLVHPTDIISQATRNEGATAFNLEEPLQWFFNCVGVLFYVMNVEDAHQNVKLLRAATGIRTPLGDLVASGKDPRTATLAAELAGMASIGVVHANLHDPVNSPPAELADYFYAVAKMGLDAAIQYNPIRAVKVCTLVAMYNIVLHATVSLAYLDLGLSLARKCGMDARECSPHLSQAEFQDMTRTYRTLVHLQCWLSASLDYVPEALGSASLLVVEYSDTSPSDTIMRDCVKVSIIKAYMLHQIPKAAPVPEAMVADFRYQLSTFHAQLADWMSLGQLLSDDCNSLHVTFRPVIFYVHMFYLSAMMLLSRRLIISYVSLDAIGEVNLPKEAHLAVQDGFVAAQTNARVMELMLTEGKVVQVCWLCIFTSYTAGVMVAYVAVQKAIHGLPFERDMELLEKCIKVLAYCALKDTVAGRFGDLLNRQLEDLQETYNLNGKAENGSTAEFVPIKTLFTFHSVPSKLDATARRLLELIQRPFSRMDNIPTEAILSNRAETAAGAHLEWEYELKGGNCVEKMVQPTEVCGIEVSIGTSIDGSELQSQVAGAWTTWTPSVGL